MSKTTLYHYASQPYNVLKTLERQNSTEDEVRRNVPPVTIKGKQYLYNQHVSFFFDPIPLDIMGTIFGGDHHVWVAGNRLYEHVVDISKVRRFAYRVVESPEKTVLMDDDSIDDAEYYRQMEIINARNKYVGDNIHDLAAAANLFRGKTRMYYEQLAKRKDFERVRSKYAPYVPHLMLYPDGGEIPVKRISQVVVGNKPLR